MGITDTIPRGESSMLGYSIGLIAVAALFGVEAYKVRERLPRLILGGLAVFFALWATLVQQIADAWPGVETFLSGLFAQPTTWFVLAVALFFVLRPYWQSKPASPPAPVTIDQLAANGVLTDVQLLRERLTNLENLPGPIHAQIDEIGSQMIVIADRLDKLEGKTEAMVTLAVSENETQGEWNGLITERLKALEVSRKEMAEREESQIAREAERIDALIKKLDDKVSRSLYALRTKEALEQIADDIEGDAHTLYDRLASGETYDAVAWDKWENVHHHWVSLMRMWIEHGKWYFGDLTTAVMDVPDHKYRGDWTVSDSQFPSAEAVRVFKKFRIIQTQWQEVKDKVRENLYYVAYHGMSDVEVRRGEQAR